MALLLLLSTAAPAVAQTSGTPLVTLTHEYVINEFGSGYLNDTFTFHNNGTSTAQIPSFQLGIPDTVASHAVAFALSPATGYTESQSDNGTVTTVTVAPNSPTLAAGTSSTVSVEAYLDNVLNITADSSTPFGAVVLLSPSVNIEINTLNLVVEVPTSGTLSPAPSEFIPSLSASPPSYGLTSYNVTPKIATQWSRLIDTDQAFFLPVQVTSVIRTVVPGTSSFPQIVDKITLRNLATYTISNLPLTLLSSSITTVTIVPWTNPPTINPTVVALTNGELTLTASPFSAPIQAGDNFTFAMEYSIPSSMVKTSGSTVSVSLPYVLPIPIVVSSYTVTTQLPAGMHAVGQSETVKANATPITQGTITVSYSVNAGWAAGQALPAAALVFAVAFLAVVIRPAKREEKKAEEEEETVSDMLADLIKGLEEKIALFGQFQGGAAGKSQGGVSRAEFVKVRNEIDALKTRAVNRLNEIRQGGGTKRFLDLLGQIQEAEREEDRAAKDVLNLYDQYHGRRMREDTFRRLLPNYRKRYDAAANRLSDLLNLAQREGKQA